MPVLVQSIRAIKTDQLQDRGKVIGVSLKAPLEIFNAGKFGRSFAFDLRMVLCQAREVTIDHAC
jgi:hypothetical protein